MIEGKRQIIEQSEKFKELINKLKGIKKTRNIHYKRQKIIKPKQIKRNTHK